MDMTDMSSTFGESESVSGSVILPGSADNKAVIELGFAYNPSTSRLIVRLVELRQLTSAGRNSSVQLRLLLLPDRKQRCKSKLRFINEVGGTVPVMETFIFNRIDQAELSSSGLRLRLYSSERLRRERLLGEAFVGLASLAVEHQREQSLLITLETKSGGPFKVRLNLELSTQLESRRHLYDLYIYIYIYFFICLLLYDDVDHSITTVCVYTSRYNPSGSGIH